MGNQTPNYLIINQLITIYKRRNIMQKKMSKSKVVVYVVMGVMGLAAIIAAATYLPGLMQRLHGG